MITMIGKLQRLHWVMNTGSENMELMIPHINELWDEILSEKIIKKNRQYGNSVYDTDTIFSSVGDPEELIKIRLDDKMRRLKTLDPESPKYDSELMEIVAYLMHLLNWRRNSGKEEESEWDPIKAVEDEIKLASWGGPSDSSGYKGNKKQSTWYIREVCDRHLQTLGLRRLPGQQRRSLREEDFQ